MKSFLGIFNKKIYLYIFFLLTISFSLLGCRDFFNNTGPMQIDYSGMTLKLKWEDDTSTVSEPSAVEHYDVFYRELGTLRWVALSSTEGAERSISIHIDQTGYGKLEFAVQSIYNNGKKGELHSSIDFSAKPAGGWFINWY